MPKKTNTKRKGAFINAQTSNKITRQEIFGAEHIVVEGSGSIIGDTVMNGIFYPLNEVKKLAKETIGKIHAPASHPTDMAGNFISAGSPEAVHQSYVGAFSFNYRMLDDRLVRDIAIDPEIANQSETGREILRRIEEGEDMDTSTGLLLNIDLVDGIGNDGEPYEMVASNMILDHDALLPNERGAATSEQGVGLFGNSDGGDDEIEFDNVDAVNASLPALRLPIAPASHQFNEADALERIKQFTNSADKPSANFRRFFLNFDRDNVDSFEAYNLLFADVINGKPHAVMSQIEAAQGMVSDGDFPDKDKAAVESAIASYTSRAESASNSDESENPTGLKGLVTKLFEMVAGNKETLYTTDNIENSDVNSTNKDEESEMDEIILAALNKAGVNTDGMDADAMLEAYNKLQAKPVEKESKVDAEAIADAVANAIKPLQDELKEIKTSANAKTEAELDSLADHVEKLEIGLTAANAKALGADAMKAIIEKNGGTVAFNARTSQRSNSNEDYSDELPSFE